MKNDIDQSQVGAIRGRQKGEKLSFLFISESETDLYKIINS